MVTMLYRRIAARIIDALVLTALIVGVGAVMGFGVLWLVLGSAMSVAYLAGSLAVTGTTIGKRLLRLRVVDSGTGRKPRLGQAVRREFVVGLGAIPFVGPPIVAAFVVGSLVSAHRRPTGESMPDRFANVTRVVDTRAT
jgi:uncharacterized RDD family membrane protein YckC